MEIEHFEVGRTIDPEKDDPEMIEVGEREGWIGSAAEKPAKTGKGEGTGDAADQVASKGKADKAADAK